MHIGQKVVCCPVTVDLTATDATKKTQSRPHTGRIVYIHPKQRFITVDFGGSRECFHPDDVLSWGKGGRR